MPDERNPLQRNGIGACRSRNPIRRNGRIKRPGGARTTAGRSVRTLCEKGTSALGESIATSVYRYYDRNGILIYVGITDRGIHRNFEHNDHAPWWPYVATQEVDHLPTRAEAIKHEKTLILQFRPPFNTQHNPDAASLREAYVAFASAARAAPDPLTLFQELRGSVPLLVLDQSEDLLTLSMSTRPAHSAIVEKLAALDSANQKLPPVLLRSNRVGVVTSVAARLGGLAVLSVSLRAKKAEQVGRIRVATLRLKHLSKSRDFHIHHVDVNGYDSPRLGARYAGRRRDF